MSKCLKSTCNGLSNPGRYRKPGSPVSERREGQLPAETIGQFLPSAWRYPYRCVCIEVQDEMRTFSCCY